MKTKKRIQWFGIWMMMPGFLVIVILKMYPILEGISYSFTNRRLDRPISNVKFIAFKNFMDVLQDQRVLKTIGFTLVYAILIVLLSYAMGLALALLLNPEDQIPGIIPVPDSASMGGFNTVTAANFRWILNDQYGIVNRMLMQLGLIGKPIQFFANINVAKGMVIGVGIWKTVPFMVIVILAALQSIPLDYYEAAEIDGASFWGKFRYIILPGIKSVTVMVTTLQFIWNFNNFESIWLLTQGGPADSTNTLPVMIYREAFQKNKIGYAAAIAVLVMVFMMIFTFVRFRITGGSSED